MATRGWLCMRTSRHSLVRRWSDDGVPDVCWMIQLPGRGGVLCIHGRAPRHLYQVVSFRHPIRRIRLQQQSVQGDLHPPGNCSGPLLSSCP